jgi:hypothetical protein
MGVSSSRNCLAREMLYPISSMIRAIRGRIEVLFSYSPKAFEKPFNPKRLPTKKKVLLIKKFLRSISLLP